MIVKEIKVLNLDFKLQIKLLIILISTQSMLGREVKQIIQFYFTTLTILYFLNYLIRETSDLRNCISDFADLIVIIT